MARLGDTSVIADDVTRAVKAVAAAAPVPPTATVPAVYRAWLDARDGVCTATVDDCASWLSQLSGTTGSGIDDSAACATFASLMGGVSLLLEWVVTSMHLAMPLEVHAAYWSERAERHDALGPIVATALDALEGGPWMWWRVAVGDEHARWTPGARAAALSALQAPLFHCIGMGKRALAGIGGCSGGRSDVVEAVVAGCTCMAAVVRSLPPPVTPTARAQDGRPADGDGVSGVGVLSLPGPYLLSVRDGLTRLTASVALATKPLLAPGPWQRHWLRWTLAAVAVVAGGRYVARHHASMRQWVGDAWGSVRGFYADHLAGPLATMYNELLGSSRTHVADDAALVDARDTLATMLSNFNGRLAANPHLRAGLSPDLQQADLKALAAALDLRPVSQRFAIEAQRPLWNAASGDLVELMLIQVAHIKKEVLTALAAMDTILAENKFNLQMTAMIPAVAVLYFAVRVVQAGVSTATAPLDTTNSRLTMRLLLHDVHHLLLSMEEGAGVTAAPASLTPGARELLEVTHLTAPLWRASTLAREGGDVEWVHAGGVTATTTGTLMPAPPPPASWRFTSPWWSDTAAGRFMRRCMEAVREVLSPGAPLRQGWAAVSMAQQVAAVAPSVTSEVGATASPSTLPATLATQGDGGGNSCGRGAGAAVPWAQVQGRLCVTLSRLQTVLSAHRSSMAWAEWQRLQRDLREVVSERWPARQRAAAVRHMMVTYPILAVGGATTRAASLLSGGDAAGLDKVINALPV